jgi:hypothetical protein
MEALSSVRLLLRVQLHPGYVHVIQARYHCSVLLQYTLRIPRLWASRWKRWTQYSGVRTRNLSFLFYSDLHDRNTQWVSSAGFGAVVAHFWRGGRVAYEIRRVYHVHSLLE